MTSYLLLQTSRASISSNSELFATSRAPVPVQVIDSGSSSSLELDPLFQYLGVSSRTRSRVNPGRQSPSVKDLNWTTSEEADEVRVASPHDEQPLPLQVVQGNQEDGGEGEGGDPVNPQETIPSCEHIDSILNPVRLQSLLEVCTPGCTLEIPNPGERFHRFDLLSPDCNIPNAVFSAQFFKLQLSLPLHPFIVEISDYYEVAPMQLTPNSYCMAVCLYIPYHSYYNTQLTADELGWFY